MPASPAGVVIAVANQKGGVGKTTTSVNLAACLTMLHQRVLLIDLDPQANATSGLGLPKTAEQSIYQVLLGGESIQTKIVPSPYARLDVVPSEVDLAGAEVDIARSDHYLHRVHAALEPLHQDPQYDVILLDCPPSLGILTMNALSAADGVLIPMQCEYYALEGLSVMTDLIERLRTSDANPGLSLEGIVMTMFDARTNLSRQVVQEVRRHFGELVYRTLIPRSVRLSEAPSHGRAVVDYDPGSTGSEAYTQLAKEFVQRRKRNAKRDAGEG